MSTISISNGFCECRWEINILVTQYDGIYFENGKLKGRTTHTTQTIKEILVAIVTKQTGGLKAVP